MLWDLVFMGRLTELRVWFDLYKKYWILRSGLVFRNQFGKCIANIKRWKCQTIEHGYIQNLGFLESKFLDHNE